MLVHEPSGNGKTQSRAFVSTLNAGAYLIELVKNRLLLIFRGCRSLCQ
jgi:hypothetical protein